MDTVSFPAELIYLFAKVGVLIVAIALWFAVAASPAK